MNILVINSSPRQRDSSAYNLAKMLIKNISQAIEVQVVEEDVTQIQQVDLEYAATITGAVSGGDESRGSLALSNQFVFQVEQADLVIIVSPIHNFSLPSGLKSWVDHVVRAGKTFTITSQGKQGLLNNKPVYILTSSGGRFSSEHAQQPDFFTPYMKDILAVIGLTDVHFFQIENTQAGKEFIHDSINNIGDELVLHVSEKFQD